MIWTSFARLGHTETKNFVLSVSDTGEGIPKELIEKIFLPFFTTKKASKGNGLGLSIVHDIITRNGGRILVTSEEKKGTTFQILFPFNQ